MAKARALVGLDVHATKIVAAVLDAETGQLQFFTLGGETAGAVAFCGQLPRPVRGRRMRRARPGTGLPASSRSVAWSARSRRRRRSRAARATG